VYLSVAVTGVVLVMLCAYVSVADISCTTYSCAGAQVNGGLKKATYGQEIQQGGLDCSASVWLQCHTSRRLL
jgi:hypothetical protein